MSISYNASGADSMTIGFKNQTIDLSGNYESTSSIYNDVSQYITTNAFHAVSTGSVGDVRLIIADNLNIDSTGSVNVSASMIILAADSNGTKPIAYLYSDSIATRITWSGSFTPYAKAVGLGTTLALITIPE